MQQCGIPDCRSEAVPGDDLCQECIDLGYRRDYQEYRALREEGYSSYKAAVMTGLKDPDY